MQKQMARLGKHPQGGSETLASHRHNGEGGGSQHAENHAGEKEKQTQRD